MSASDVLPQLIADGSAFLAGKVLGRKFALDQAKALRLGHYIIYGTIALAGVIIGLIYS